MSLDAKIFKLSSISYLIFGGGGGGAANEILIKDKLTATIISVSLEFFLLLF